MAFRFSIVLIFLLSGFPGSLRAELNQFWIESDLLIPIEAEIERGSLVSNTQDPHALRALILRQLHFSIGQLNALSASPALGISLQINVQNITPSLEGWYDVSYDAKFLIAWDKTNPPFPAAELLLPLRADEEGIKQFHETYVKTCGLPFEEGPETFFFYFRPDRSTCTIKSDPHPPLLIRTEMHLKEVSLSNPQLSPQYHRIWANRKLTASFYFEKFEPEFPSGAEEFYSLLIKQYGQPLVSRRYRQNYFSYIRALFLTRSGQLDVSIFDMLEGDITTVKCDFETLLKRRARFSDFIAYNGHSGYGKKVRRFTQLISPYSLTPYKLLYLNGCDTFSYIDHTLFNTRTQVDVITTGLAGYFTSMPTYSMSIIQSLVDRNENFSELLSNISFGSPVLLSQIRSAQVLPRRRSGRIFPRLRLGRIFPRRR